MENESESKKNLTSKKESGTKKKKSANDVHSEIPKQCCQNQNISSHPRNHSSYISSMRASLAVLNVLEEQCQHGPLEPQPTFRNPPDNSLDESKLADYESKIFDIEQKIKMVSRRLNESRRGQMILEERVEELENSIHKSHMLNVVQELLNIIPTEKDLSLLEKMKHIQAKRLEKNRNIRAREREQAILSRTLGRAEAIITETSIIKRPKRVVIVEDEIIQIHSDTEKSKKFIPSHVRKMDGLYYKGLKKVAYGPYFGDEEQEEGEEDEEEGEGEEGEEGECEDDEEGEGEEGEEREVEDDEEGEGEEGEEREVEDDEEGVGEEGEEREDEDDEEGEGEEGEEREVEDDDEESSEIMTSIGNQNSQDIEKLLQSIINNIRDTSSEQEKYGHSSKDFTNESNYFEGYTHEDQASKHYSTEDDEDLHNGQIPHTSKAGNTRHSSEPSETTESESENKDNTSSTDK